MASRRRIGAIVSGLALTALGAGGATAWRDGLWGSLAGATLAAGWLLALGWWAAARAHPAAIAERPDDRGDGLPVGLLLDQMPLPLLAVTDGIVHALNRPARWLFATDDRVTAPPAALLDETATHVLHEARQWRIDRIDLRGRSARRTIVALIDVEAEARSAEARASTEMIQILGHELLNGLSPIVSLAESGLAALTAPGDRDGLLPEILGTLSRRAEGLLRFAEAYRALARLPAPARSPVTPAGLVGDLERLFAGRWADRVALDIRIEADAAVWIDRDQMTQAIWALLQNAAEAAIPAPAPPRVALDVRLSDARLIVDVADSGPGVPTADATRIFRPFHTTKPAGTGIGLSLARQIAQAHGGALTLAASHPTLFRIAIPDATARSPGEIVRRDGPDGTS